MSSWDDITACANKGCEHRPSCYRARIYDEREGTPAYLKTSYFSRDPAIGRMRGWDCYWSIDAARGRA